MSEAKSRRTKLIIDSAVELFKKHGYENVSVNDICAAAGIARSTFYLNFSCKKQIIEKMLAGVHLNKDEYFSDFIAAEMTTKNNKCPTEKDTPPQLSQKPKKQRNQSGAIIRFYNKCWGTPRETRGRTPNIFKSISKKE